LTSVRADTIGNQIHEVQKAADERLRDWVNKHYADLP
jgi:hypothetical protein